MFFSFRCVFWLSAVMAVFFYVPFNVTGFSTDVWIRLARIREWAEQGFPFGETLMSGQNWPVGFEMHWTRLLDWIGYAAAWPFIPSFGLKRSLEIMACFVPLLVLIIGIRGFFYAMRGYVTPKVAFFSFWLFFYGVGYIWGQASIGYFDHHIFHFALLVWTGAFIMRFYQVSSESQTGLLLGAAFLTALGTWLTPEFCSVLIFMLLPFLFGWLFQNRSLKPAFIYAGGYGVFVFLIVFLNPPFSGVDTNIYDRISLFHGIVGVLLCGLFFLLMFLFKKMRTSFLRRLIYGTLAGVLFLSLLFLFFFKEITYPMTDLFLFHLWIEKVSEMRSVLSHPYLFAPYVFVPGLVALLALIAAFLNFKDYRSCILFMLGCGLLCHVIIVLFHVRGSIALFSYFLLLMPFVLSYLFFPRERSFGLSLSFVIVYLIFIGMNEKGLVVSQKIIDHGISSYYHDYSMGMDNNVPDMVKQAFEKRNSSEEEKVDALFNHKKEDESYSCRGTQALFDVITAYEGTGSVLADIFQSPEILWETERPVWGGPYHGMRETHRDFIRTILDRPPFKTAERFLDKYQTRLFYLVNPRCMHYLMINEDSDLEDTFYLSAYYETPLMSKRLKRLFYDEKSGIKIFEVLPALSEETH